MYRFRVVLVVLGTLLSSAVSAQHAKADALSIPASIQAEHERLLAELDAALKAGGETANKAAELKKVLMPHFQREEEVALPPLGALRPCVEGPLSGEMATRVRTLSTTLKNELPSMLKEHQSIRKAVQSLREAATAEKKERAVAFAEALAEHARTEEEVLYPAAVVVGKCVQ